jgi:hypothetical protein
MSKDVLNNIYRSMSSKNPYEGLQEFDNNEYDHWLKDLGLYFNPFDLTYLDAGEDPQLPAYLIGHESFAAIWQGRTSFVFAPVGGGKTAFRVRLARACRVGQDGRRIFPVIYKMPSPTHFEIEKPDLDHHLTYINHAIAQELLLALAYNPGRFFDFEIGIRTKIYRLLVDNLPFNLEIHLQQLSDKGTLMPLVKLFDRTAERLFTLPHPDEIRNFCKELMEVSQTPAVPGDPENKKDATERFEELVEFLKETLGYESIYVLVDGVDAYIEAITRPQLSVDLLKPLLNETGPWAIKKIFMKYFLPTEFDALITLGTLSFPGERTPVDIVRVNWTLAMLEELIQERLRVASKGIYSSLDAICSPELHGVIQTELILEARARIPREVLTLAAYLLEARFRRTRSPGQIERIDFEAAKQRYNEERPT